MDHFLQIVWYLSVNMLMALIINQDWKIKMKPLWTINSTSPSLWMICLSTNQNKFACKYPKFRKFCKISENLPKSWWEVYHIVLALQYSRTRLVY